MVFIEFTVVDDLPPINSNPTCEQTSPSSTKQPVRSTESLKPVDDDANNVKRNSLQVLTNVISDFLTPAAIATTDKRKLRLDRPYGESLTTTEALHKIQQKENQTLKRKKPAATKGTSETKKAPAKR